MTGTYNVTLVAQNGSCSDSSNSIVTVINSIGVNQYEDFDVQLYPNPSNGKLFIKSAFSEIDQIQVYNLIGEVYKNISYLNNAGIIEVDLHWFPAGVYFVQITKDSNQITKRVVLMSK